MGKGIALGSVLACIVLLFCLACGIVSQASHTWWKIESTSVNHDYYFGLYRFCMDEPTGEICYRFDEKDMLKFMQYIVGDDQANRMELLEIESTESKNLWILSFFFIVILGVAAIVSIFAAFQAMLGKAIFITIVIEIIFTFAALILGVASVAFASNKQNDIFRAGVHFLATNGRTTTDVDLEGRGFLFQTISAVSIIVPYAIYLLLLMPAKRLQRKNRLNKEGE